jgi:hypothetical protein
VLGFAAKVQAVFFRRRHQPRRPTLAKIRPEIESLQLAQERKRVLSQQSVVIEPGASLIHASMRAALAELDEGTFTEGLELDLKTVARHCQRSTKLTI